MNQFFISLILLGIILIIAALIGIAYDRKKSRDHLEGLEQKKNELSSIVDDADQMIDELNRLSDYVVTQMDSKNEEMSNILKDVETRIGNIKTRLNDNSEAYEIPLGIVVNGGEGNKPHNKVESTVSTKENEQEIVKNFENTKISNTRKAISSYKTHSNYKGNVIPINNRYA
jgi:FtsZ-interacting cell division protein ZipA